MPFLMENNHTAQIITNYEDNSCWYDVWMMQ